MRLGVVFVITLTSILISGFSLLTSLIKIVAISVAFLTNIVESVKEVNHFSWALVKCTTNNNANNRGIFFILYLVQVATVVEMSSSAFCYTCGTKYAVVLNKVGFLLESIKTVSV